MQIKGSHSVTYSIKGEKETIEVRVELKQIDSLKEPRQNVWYAIVIVNDREINHPDAPYCVNAQYMAEQIVEEKLKELRAEHGPALRIRRKKK
jgi:hypothetical protein